MGGQNGREAHEIFFRIQEEGENQVTYQSIGIWMFWIRIHTQIFDKTNNLHSSITSKQILQSQFVLNPFGTTRQYIDVFRV